MKKIICLMVVLGFAGVCFGEKIDVVVIHKIDKKHNNSITNNASDLPPEN